MNSKNIRRWVGWTLALAVLVTLIALNPGGERFGNNISTGICNYSHRC